MTPLEKVVNLKKEGKSEAEIIATLRAEGVSPMKISDAINQSKIKEAVSDNSPTQGMTPSIMGVDEDGNPIAQEKIPEMPQKEETQSTPPQELYAPQPTSPPQPPQTMNSQTETYQPQQNYQPQEQYYDPYQQQGYSQDPFAGYEQPQQDYYQPGFDDYSQDYSNAGYAGSTDAMIEVAEQVFTEKMKKLSKEIKQLTEFKTIFQTRVENLSNRLERMEKYFDKMQLEILQKVSEYGKGMDYMKKELKMVEDSFEKLSKKF